MSRITALFVNTFEKKVSQIELNCPDDIDLEQCYKLLKCDLVEFVYFGDREILIVDEEGLLKEENVVFRLEGVGQEFFMGNALIVQEGNEKCVSLDEDKINNLLNMISFPVLQEVE